MKISKFVWNLDRIDHIAKHNITPDEVESACFGNALVLKAKSEGKNSVYYVLGQTDNGRYLFSVIIQFPDGKGYPVTSRTMTESEKQRYKKWSNQK